ncbi:MAG: hypothetical protein II837_02190 [Treponema sp.]|nr:hypothetical protein [Treponema sp.]
MSVNRIAKVMSVSFMPEMYNKIDSYCKFRGCTRSWFINKATQLYLTACLEDQADYDAAVAAWKENEESGGKTYSIEEIRRELDL